MHHFLGMADQGQHRKEGFDQHPVVPRAAWTEFEVGRIAVSGMKSSIREDQHPVLEPLDQGVKNGIMNLSRRTQPAHDAAPAIRQETKLIAHDPTVVGKSLAADLGWATTLSNRVEEFDTLAVHDTQ